VTLGGDPDAETVTRAGAEAAADVQPGRDAVAADPASEQQHTRPQHVGRVRQREYEVDDRAHDQRVGERANAGPLVQRDPQEQYRQADDDHPRADPEPKRSRESLVQHVPRIEPQLREHDHPGGRAVEHETRGELREPAGAVVGWDGKQEARQATSLSWAPSLPPAQ
jgi:hypothetical protein